MKQVLHIFRKDTRHLWMEIVASLVALSMFAALSPERWSFTRAAMRWQPLLELVTLLVLGTWILLAARLVQGESLVGDRQFWVTRPYEWKKLLAAKTLFALVWIYVPYVLAQAAILRESGFSPLAHAGGWGTMLAVLTGCLILPLAVMAATTGNLARMALTSCGVVVALIAGVNLATMPRGGYDSTVPNDHHMWVVGVLTAGALLAIPLQYAMRRVWLVRGVVLGTAVIAIGLAAALTVTHEGQIDRLYPVQSTPPVQLAMPVRTDTMYIVPSVQLVPSERPGMVYVLVPVDFSGVAEGAAVQLDDVKIAIDDASSGWHWTAPWWTSEPLRVLPGTHRGRVEIMLGRDQLKRFVQGSATMRLTLAVTELRAGRDTTAAFSPTHDFAVAGFGVCSALGLNRFNQLLCRSAMGAPPPTHVTATWYPKECPDQERIPNAPMTAAAWSGGVHADSWTGSVFTVQPVLVNLYPDWHDGYDLYRTVGDNLCPGTVLHFTQYTVAGRTQVSLTLPNSYFQVPMLDKILHQLGEP